MDKENLLFEQQDTQSSSKIENINNLDIEKKLDILKNSELKSLFWFGKFISYLSTQSDTVKLDTVISILQSKEWKNKLLAYFDIDNEDWWKWFIKDEKTYTAFEKDFVDILIAINNKKETKRIEEEAKRIEEEAKNSENKINEIIKTLDKTWLEDIILELNNKKTTVEKLDYLNKEEVQNRIFEALEKEARKTNNPEKLEKITQSFFDLKIIDRTRYDELQRIITDIKFPSKDPNKTPPQEPITPTWYSSRWDTLYKSTDKTSFTIEDWKITSVSNSSWLKLTDYNTLDEDGKKLTEKVKLEVEIKELTSDLSENKNKKTDLDRLELMIRGIKPEDITKENINMIIAFLWNSFPLLDNQLLWIYSNKEANPEEKLQYIIKLLYWHITWSTDTSEINWLKPIDQINLTKNKIIENDTTLNKSLQEKQKKLEELKKLYPNLDEKSIQEKIKSQENKMQDTVDFCDKYGLSTFWNIANIKKIIKLINEVEKEKKANNEIPEDIWTWLKFKQEETLDLYPLYLSRLFNRKDLYKNWWIWWLWLEFSYKEKWKNITTTKTNLELLLKKNYVLKPNWELNGDDKYLKEVLRKDVEEEMDIDKELSNI